MRVIILAAGKGERLMPLTKKRPKSLIRIKGGRTLLETQVRGLASSGINEITLVVGYRASMLVKAAGTLSKKYGVSIETVYNPRFSASNNLVSLWAAKKRLKEDFIVLNGDVVFERDVLKRLLACKPGSGISMVVDKKRHYDLEDMKAVISGGRVVDVGKDIIPKKANAESIGFIKLVGKGREKFYRETASFIRRPESRKVFYLAVFRELMRKGYGVAPCRIKHSQWAEVDFHGDLQALKKAIGKSLKLQ